MQGLVISYVDYLEEGHRHWLNTHLETDMTRVVHRRQTLPTTTAISPVKLTRLKGLPLSMATEVNVIALRLFLIVLHRFRGRGISIAALPI